ncbi:DUF317 domain-containing protein [Streptomyces sp. NPDC001508]|uniref:DUF317 domain-containing protein n=1 Tax=Streptomyces sp. NPDC001508 TaxID=3154656 RepID=UPI00332659ED
MPVNERQLRAFADTHAWRIPFDTSPRHLAGPGDARHVTHGLAAVGWTRTSDPLSAEILLTSPDHRYTLQFDPQSSTSAWWRLRAQGSDTAQHWYCEFGQLVPAEVLSSVTDTLVAPPASKPADEPADPWEAAASGGWLRDVDGTAHSPDGMGHIELRHLDSKVTESWHIDVCEPGYGDPWGPRIWHARFDSHTPSHLVTAFITALVDPAPLQRGFFDATAHYSAVQERSQLRPQQVVDAHADRLASLGTRARTARRREQPATTSVSAPATATAPIRR